MVVVQQAQKSPDIPARVSLLNLMGLLTFRQRRVMPPRKDAIAAGSMERNLRDWAEPCLCMLAMTGGCVK